ncbi:hypothetical protein IKE_06453 [Bacillus cereus VD196]|uniref:Uncharacterized protein n=1 Tax=Bacillus cereus VD196 TaxID=1053243 RepID=A0A9W5V5F0_BACCE|nr:hypothetical protein [Bacillus cereus]EJR89507.1 hypothetical protein IKG_06121 [Bacillus cereus VD200]EOO56614.1 hypothetical protein IKE_06453 [Bacillus cereus VD196]
MYSFFSWGGKAVAGALVSFGINRGLNNMLNTPSRPGPEAGWVVNSLPSYGSSGGWPMGY